MSDERFQERDLLAKVASESASPEEANRVFIGTVHSFSLTQIVMPYAKSARLDLPDEFTVATGQEQRYALEDAFRRTIGGPGNPQNWSFRMGNYRRSILNRNSAQWHTEDPELARLVEAYEEELRARGLIDFDDMPLLAVRALRDNEWLQRAILAKYPVIMVDDDPPLLRFDQDIYPTLHALPILQGHGHRPLRADTEWLEVIVKASLETRGTG